ncbi:MAG: hypothetical protein KG003_15065 [Bacteroidetes bacterium]|nr:hypothetical protein [Bacteroidota bacterium]
MNLKTLIFTAVVIAGATQRLSAQKEDFLTAGTLVPIIFTHTVCSDGNDQIRAFIGRDIKGDSNRTVIKAGESVNITINKKPAGAWGRPGRIEVIVNSVLATDGQEVLLNGSDFVEGKKKRTGAILFSAGLGLSLLPVLGFFSGFLIKGDEVCIQSVPVVRVMETKTIKTR